MLEIFDSYKGLEFPFISYPIAAGDPLENDAPVDMLSLDDYISKNGQREILYVRVSGDSMRDLAIFDGAIVSIDRNKKPENGSVVLARLGATYTIKTWKEIEPFTKRKKFYLVPANDDYKQRIVKADEDFEIIGVMTFCLNSY